LGHRSFHHCCGQNDALREFWFLCLPPLGRTAYAFSQDKLPPSGQNLEWKTAPSFNAASEVMGDPGLKELFM